MKTPRFTIRRMMVAFAILAFIIAWGLPLDKWKAERMASAYLLKTLPDFDTDTYQVTVWCHEVDDPLSWEYWNQPNGVWTLSYTDQVGRPGLDVVVRSDGQCEIRHAK